MKTDPNALLLRRGLALMLALAPGAVAAPPALEGIIVNAAGGRSALLQTPAAITAFGVAQRERLGLEGPLDLAAHTPSLSITPQEVNLRGVGDPGHTLGSDPGVGIYWDGVYSTDNAIFNYARFLDIERVEVLRGPQGTVYGRGAIGGAITFASLQPGPIWRGKVVAEVSSYNGTLLQGLASGPITDHTSILTAVSCARRDSFQDNVQNGAGYEQDDSLYGTFSIKHVTTDRWVSRLKLLAVDQDFSPSRSSERQAVFFSSEYFGDSYSIKYTGGWSNNRSGYAADTGGTTAEDSGLDWRELLLFDEPVESLTGYELTPAQMTVQVEQEASSVSHELQYFSNWNGRFSLLGGLYYYRSQQDQLLSYRGEADLVTRSTAVYGQLQWDWTERTAVSLGLRYSHDEKEGGDNTFAQFVGDPAKPTVYRQRRDSWSEPTWRLAVDHLFADRHFVYAAAATGYRPGGFNLQKPTSSPAVEVVDPEQLLSYELGYKGRLWRNRLNIAVAAYYYDFEDLQVVTPDVIAGAGLSTSRNAEDASAMGVEVELRALLMPDLLLGGSWSYNETEYGEVFAVDTNACALGPLAQGRSQDPLCQQAQDLAGNGFPLTPEHKLSLNLTYQWQLAGMDWSATGAYLYAGEQYMAPFNEDRYDRVGSWQRWDARLAARSPSGAWETTVFIKNIADDRGPVLRGRPDTVTRVASADRTRPRVYGLRVDYRF